MEPNVLALLATLGGFALPFGMGFKVLAEIRTMRREERANDADFLRLVINDKDYSVDLKTINNGGSKKIHAALTELERCA